MSVKEKTTTDTVEDTQKVAAVATNSGKPTTVMYVGPTIQNVILKNTVFNNGITPVLQNKVKDHPYLNGLLIPLSNLTTAKKDLEDAGSAISVLYQKAKKI